VTKLPVTTTHRSHARGLISPVTRASDGLFGRALLQKNKLQLRFSSFSIKQLQQIVKVGFRSVWLAYGL
jgi:hypothetical protein